MENKKLGTMTATLLVVATMIGTGVFTTTGFMVESLQNDIPILLVWLLGGVLALCGALSYAELSAIMPRNGGEYHLLSKIYRPSIGFVSGWIAFIVGFSASVASSAMAFGKYLEVLTNINSTFSAILLIIILSFIHGFNTNAGTKFQNLFTIFKIVFISIFILSGLFLGEINSIQSSPNDFKIITSTTFAISLVFVSYSYSGWNAAIYIAGEMEQPEKNLPIALLLGTIIVTLLYFGLNLIYLLIVPKSEIAGILQVGHVTAKYIFGNIGAVLMSSVISFGLVSAVGSMIMSGPRIYQVIGEDFKKLSFLSKKSKNGAPTNAVFIQSFLSLIFIMTSSFDVLLTYIGFTLSIVASLSVLGVIILRFREPDIDRPYKTWGYPFIPILFLLLSSWMIVYSIIENPTVALAGLGTIVSGFIVYFFIKDSRLELEKK